MRQTTLYRWSAVLFASVGFYVILFEPGQPYFWSYIGFMVAAASYINLSMELRYEGDSE